MSKKAQQDQDVVPIQHQTALRIMIAERAIAQVRMRADLEARQAAIREYLIQILEEAGLDQHVFGISPDLRKFVVVELPKSTVEPAEKPVANVAEAKELSGKENMKVPE